tara:strand:+ start:815 stop:916 length:102 start_codon:yes stop_codon:yes gene_type:complete
MKNDYLQIIFWKRREIVFLLGIQDLSRELSFIY